MIKNKIKNAKGISLISLAIAVVILILMANLIIYNVKDNLKVGNLKEMQNDIANLRDKIASYYAQNGKLPASIPYTNISHIKSSGVISDVIDTGEFFVIELSALENLTLNYGEDYEKVKEASGNVDEYEDLYIINEASHNIFYVRGITIDNETFYTDYTSEKVDSKAVDLRYVEGVKIPDGFYYVSGTKDTGIVIKSNNDTEEYMWIQSDIMTEIPNDVQIDTNEQEDFMKSANAYKGYYKNTSSNDVIFLELEKWSPIYDKEGKYTDKNGDTAYIPKDFRVSEVPGQNTIDDGLVIQDLTGNYHYVWIEVPKSIYKTAISGEDYENIEKDMQVYAKDYRKEDYTDTWYSQEQHGFASKADYDSYKQKMLKDVYEKGGFWIAQYEMGTQTIRTSSNIDNITPVSKEGMYPYNWLTCKQAQQLANNINFDQITNSLPFGIQWDLVMKFIEVKGAKTQIEINNDSTSWGNYLNSNFDIIKGAYSIDGGGQNFTEVKKIYTKSNLATLFTTGVTNRNKVLNIYDLAGNIYEWSLERTGECCCGRGGYPLNNGDLIPASYRGKDAVTNKNYYIGFRTVLMNY